MIYKDSNQYIQEMTLVDWWKNGVSKRNKDFYKIRKSKTNQAYLESVSLTNGILLKFKVIPTYKKKDVLIFDKKGNKRGGNYYTLEILFDGADKEIDDWKSLSYKQKKDRIMAFINTWDNTKFYSNDPSFFIQGAWFRINQLDSSIYPFPQGFDDKGIWASKHGTDIYLTKHFLNVFEIIKFIIDDIVKKLDKLV